MAAREHLHQLSISSLSSMSVRWSHSPLLSSHTRGGRCPLWWQQEITNTSYHLYFRTLCSSDSSVFFMGDTKQKIHRSVVKHWPLTADRINYIRDWDQFNSFENLKAKSKGCGEIKETFTFCCQVPFTLHRDKTNGMKHWMQTMKQDCFPPGGAKFQGRSGLQLISSPVVCMICCSLLLSSGSSEHWWRRWRQTHSGRTSSASEMMIRWKWNLIDCLLEDQMFIYRDNMEGRMQPCGKCVFPAVSCQIGIL